MRNYTKSKLSKNLSKFEIIQICKLKNTQWKYGLSSQVEWFKKHVKNDDIHNFILYKKKIISYTLLRKRSLFLKNLKRSNYLYFDTLIVGKNYRNLGVGKKIMILNSKVIKKNKLPSLLLCDDKLISFYKKYGWKKINEKKINIQDHKLEKKNIMQFNLNKRILTKISIYIYQ